MKEEALDPTLWKTRFGRVCGPVVKQIKERDVLPNVHDVQTKTAVDYNL